MVKVKKSRIHGAGVFASTPIPANRRLFKYEGRELGRAEARRLEKQGADRYLFELDRAKFIDGDLSTPAARVNHSCDPNTRVGLVGGELVFYARRPIKNREELTFDYAYSSRYKRVLCKCNASKCRGTINLRNS